MEYIDNTSFDRYSNNPFNATPMSVPNIKRNNSLFANSMSVISPDHQMTGIKIIIRKIVTTPTFKKRLRSNKKVLMIILAKNDIRSFIFSILHPSLTRTAATYFYYSKILSFSQNYRLFI